MKDVVEKIMHFRPKGLSPGSAISKLYDLWASVSSPLKDREWS